VTNNCGFWITFIGTSLELQSIIKAQAILTAEASHHAASRSTTGCKRPSFSSINFRNGPRTENTLRKPYRSNSSIVIEMIIIVLLPAYLFRREYV
jgi:hypothetical protein